ncbi:uncharacterized protein LTR77_008762 [Saxophila tyrrhenica]|uniref:Sulfatase N-terminal domain-containing protein n=1 Tax=Saxophila tyrrhenica TaxID=1690608 RepID=A0AAV9P498_9PEZI|nr:hypothetical protein LTR77_008762 [Saxophila tyrrhenica]
MDWNRTIKKPEIEAKTRRHHYLRSLATLGQPAMSTSMPSVATWPIPGCCWDKEGIVCCRCGGVRSLLLLRLAEVGLAATPKAKKPNVIVILADDQDMLLDSLSVQPNVVNQIGKQGVTYNKHYCTVAWCCPSRVNFLTGRAAHNTNVTTLTPPYGGWSKFMSEGHNDNWLPVWINTSGIKTFYAGKLMNGYSNNNFDRPAHPKGWHDSSFLIDPWTYNYFNSHWTNGYTDKVKAYPGVHTTHVNAEKALGWLDNLGKNKDQFFMMIATVAPHMGVAAGSGAPPPPASQKGKFLNQVSPRRPNFNPDTPSGNSWIRGLPKLSKADVKSGDEVHVGRLQNLAGIDEVVGDIIDKLKKYDIFDNTYIIYTSDNGFHIGNHRLKPGKRCPYEEDINVPLLIRGPNVAKGVVSTVANHHTDMAPTILEMLGVPLRPDFDGGPIAYTANDFKSQRKNEHVQVEFWDGGFAPNGYRGEESGQLYFNNTYKALRIWNPDDNFSALYSVWCDNSKEFYDMSSDYAQMHNLLLPKAIAGAPKYWKRPLPQLVARLDTLLLVLKGCKKEACRKPWDQIFPKDTVNNVEQAMDAKYDDFFRKQPKVHYKSCKGGNVISNEGPQKANVWKGK